MSVNMKCIYFPLAELYLVEFGLEKHKLAKLTNLNIQLDIVPEDAHDEDASPTSSLHHHHVLLSDRR